MLGRASVILGILAILNSVVGFVLLTRVWPGDSLPIGIVTTLHYVLPLAGVVMGHMARRREGPRTVSTVGLVLSYLCLAGAVVPLLLDLLATLV